jgi:chromosome partitioning protein
MAKVITFTIQKGGVAKTTSAAVVGYLLGEVFEKKVLMVDMDTQGNLSEVFLKDRTKRLIKEGKIPGTILEAMVDEEDVRPYIFNVMKNVDIVPASDDLAGLPAYLHDRDMFQEKIKQNPTKYHVSKLLKITLEPVMDQYDFIIIDTQPSLSELVTNAWVAADYIIIPFDLSRYAISALEDFFENLEQIQKNVNPNLKVYGILPTMVERVRTDHRFIMEEFSKDPTYGRYILPYYIPRRASIGRLSHLKFFDNDELMDLCGSYIPLVKGLLEA